MELTQENWAQAVEWRPYVYKRIARFGRKVMARAVYWSGTIGEPSFQWHTGGGRAYGADPSSILEDLEAPALEAAARAAHSFDPGRGTKFSTYLTRVVDNALQDAFDSWVRTSSSLDQYPIDWVEEEHVATRPGQRRPLGQNDYYAPEDGSSFDEETEAALQEAMGALTAKEAWALRMYADGVPVQVIQERLGHDRDTSTYALIKRAKEKARQVMQDQLPEADVQ